MNRPEDNNQPIPYYQAAHFSGERPAGRAYARAQDLIYQQPCHLSAYRFLLERSWHVAIVGEPPPEALDRSLRRILAWGAATTLPDDIVQQLWQRRTQAIKLGPWQTSSGLALRRVAVELAEKRDPRTHPHPSVLGQTAPNG